MSTLPPCPKCNSEFTYEDGDQLICPECAHEWSATGETEAAGDETVKKDSVGNVLQDGDTITVIKDLTCATATTISTAKSTVSAR